MAVPVILVAMALLNDIIELVKGHNDHSCFMSLGGGENNCFVVVAHM